MSSLYERFKSGEIDAVTLGQEARAHWRLNWWQRRKKRQRIKLPSPNEALACWKAAVEGHDLGVMSSSWLFHPECRCALWGKRALQVSPTEAAEYLSQFGERVAEKYPKMPSSEALVFTLLRIGDFIHEDGQDIRTWPVLPSLAYASAPPSISIEHLTGHRPFTIMKGFA